MSEIRSQATPARDELAEKVFDLLVTAESMGEQRRNVIAHGIAMGLEDAGWSKPRTVNSAAELDALPVNSVVVDASDTPRTKRYGDSHMGAGWTNAGRSPLSSRELADGRPMRVLFTPGDAG
ncbi:hypothetical protein [Rhodococcus qingshengii]|uniref:hypothetical protein n=1 Tax=Rhodococcus qingshengii TaxID=334542 RepID=UPI002AFDF6C2|nr:hypothetical protein [Rhodococcus qingshengii]MEA1798528.1 hypothetical protein [Rhodococcus qingshengii]